MTITTLTAVLAGFLALAAPYDRQSAPLPAFAVAAQSTTLEGCLGAGASDGEFALSVGGERYAVVAGAGVNLATHVNHKVQISGTVEKTSAGNVLRASAVKMVATACDAA